jgi:hypothetical protein
MASWSMAKVANLPERQDVEGVWHQVLRDACGWCGCHYLIAEDDHDLVWEPGKHYDDGCTDGVCECHARPRIGRRHDEW